MFTDLTNQVCTWMDNLKKLNNTETPEENQDKTYCNDISTNLINQLEEMGDWLGSNIPKFFDITSEEKNINTTEVQTNTIEKTNMAIQSNKIEEKTLIDKVEMTMDQLKKSFKRTPILPKFNEEQRAFIKNKKEVSSTPLPPWAGCLNETGIKEECLAISLDERNFLRSPPEGIEYVFNYDISYPVAFAVLKQDNNLEKMRYKLVPSNISEINFWRNYFYRVSLILKANEISLNEVAEPNNDIMREEVCLEYKSNEEDWERELNAELLDYEIIENIE
ncbi:unnamed protein product [Brassicogethes aeneus]|uniref:BSD domain-containing protein n=1 Tax=Brassicogethes aeneus TaxID=1431903 RepID=A0A9P0FEG7_BRAAE|nr:unnamed protein product [Brassicogethes aeneus]